MATNDYVFATLWRVAGKVDSVYRVLVDIEDYPHWWPEVYLQVEPLTPLKKTIGDRVRLLTRGKLPYKIRWQSEIVQANPPHGFMLRATGDFTGRGIWSLKHSKFVVAFQAALSLGPSLGRGPRSGRPWPQNDVGPLNRLAFGIVNAHNEDSR